MSLDGVSLVSLDVDKIYNNISQELDFSAAKEYLNSRHPSSQTVGCNENEDLFVSTDSLLEGLDLCINNNNKLGLSWAKLSQGPGYSLVEVKISQELMYKCFFFIPTYGYLKLLG